MGYEFQGRLEAEAWEWLQAGRVVLAAAPGAGKTDMAIRLIERWCTKRRGKVLVLTHGQTILRSQFRARLLHNSNKLANSGRVRVALPHEFIRREASRFGLIVVDEAHQFYRAQMVQSILEQNPEAKLLLLTGSPSWFVGAGFPIVAMSAFELLEAGVIVNPHVELVQTELPFTAADYNQDEDLKTDVRMSTKQINSALDDAMERLTGEVVQRLNGKTLVVCQRQSQARVAQRYFIKHGVEALLSTSDTDEDSEAIYEFKTGPAQVLVVVNRAALGFDYPAMRNVIDISCSMNPDRLFQALCRVVRRHGDVPKTYVKVTPKNTAELTHHVMSFVMAYGAPELYRTWTGSWKDVRVAKTGRYAGRGESDGEEGERQIDLPHFYTFQEVAQIEHGDLEATHWSTFTETKYLLSNRTLNWTLEKCRERALKYQTRWAWGKADSGAYQAAALNGWLEVCCAHMKRCHEVWTLEKCLASARQHETRAAWAAADRRALNAAVRNHWLNECCSHMKPRTWTLTRCKESAAKYSTRQAWRNDGDAAYQAAHKNGWLEECCEHMSKADGWAGRRYTLEDCKAQAQQYDTKIAWVRGHEHSYRAARRNGWVDECCGHMVKGDSWATRRARLKA